MGVACMSWSNCANSDINDLFRDCVRAEMKHGPRNECGAIATVAAQIGVSPQIVKLRCRDHVTGRPRIKNLRERCWSFLDRVAEREKAWAEALLLAVERQRDELQLRLPLEGGVNVSSGTRSAAWCLERADDNAADARHALDVYRNIRAKVKRP